MARRNKPYDPATATQAALERREREAEVRRLQQQGATVKTDRAGKIVSAFRSNVFNLLRDRGTITANHHDAAHRLVLDWAAWKGLEGRPEQVGGGSGSAELITDRMVLAGKRVEWALSQVPPVSRLLLERLVGDTVEQDRPRVWRVQVKEAIGEESRDRQAQAVVDALEALRVVFQEPRRAAA